MKKLLAFLLLPALVFGVVALTDIVAKDDVDYEVALGNQLSTITFDSKT